MLSYINNLFTPKPPPFVSQPRAKPPRKDCNGSCSTQPQSLFFQLPGEIRNEIYTYVFQSTPEDLSCPNPTHDTSSQAPQPPSLSPHPLSLLLTCHLAHHEATPIAFAAHTFPVTYNTRTAYFTMRDSLTPLFPAQISSITRLSYDIGRSIYYGGHGTSHVLTNALLLLPSLSSFTVRVQLGRKPAREIHRDPYLGTESWLREFRHAALRRYAPGWFQWGVVVPAAGNVQYAWRKGERWEVVWPQLESVWLQALDTEDGGWEKEPFMSPDAIGAARGVHACLCGCEFVSWTSADLVQETGRVVAVDTVFYGPEDPYETEAARQFATCKLKLVPGAKPLELVRDDGFPGGMGFDADEEYWEGVRRRNGDLGAIWRGFWRKPVVREQEEGEGGSRAMGEASLEEQSTNFAAD